LLAKVEGNAEAGAEADAVADAPEEDAGGAMIDRELSLDPAAGVVASGVEGEERGDDERTDVPRAGSGATEAEARSAMLGVFWLLGECCR